MDKIAAIPGDTHLSAESYPLPTHAVLLTKKVHALHAEQPEHETARPSVSSNLPQFFTHSAGRNFWRDVGGHLKLQGIY